MANLTITVEDDLLKRARIRAAEQGTSVNAVLRSELERFAGKLSVASAMESFLEIARSNTAASDGKGWRREDLYEGRAIR